MSEQDEARLARFVQQTAGISGAKLGPVLAGGNSNVTRLVESDDGMLVLRHPPSDAISDRAAAGIAREYAALCALRANAPVPETIAWCADPTIIGVPFSLTRFVEGVSIRNRLPEAYGASPGAISAIGRAMVETLAVVHRANPAPLISQGFGRPESFVERQITRWRRVRAESRVRDLPDLERIASWLLGRAPQPLPGRIVHCDYHLDNCLSDPDRPGIRAIIDWEMAGVADPRIDLGLALFFWQRDPCATLGFSWIQAFSNRSDVVSRGELAALWSRASGLSAEDWSYFTAFAAWRLAAIVEGAYVLYCRGNVDTGYARALEEDVPALLAEVSAMIEKEAA